MRVIALDPGVTTGYAVGEITEGHLQLITGQERWSHLELWGFFEDHNPNVIISERFEFRNKARAGLELYSRELIGICNLYAQMYFSPPHEIVLQNAMKGTGGNFFTDKRLKDDNIYKEGRDHANDAARHLLYWFQFGPGFKFNQKGYSYVE